MFSQTTLDDVFVTFAKTQKDDDPGSDDEDKKEDENQVTEKTKRKSKYDPLNIKTLQVKPRHLIV